MTNDLRRNPYKNARNVVGQRFGRFVVIREEPRHYNSKRRVYRIVLCRCDCGKEKTVFLSALKSGNTKSCGCLNIESASKTHFKHGHHNSITKTNSPTYASWLGMIQRCTNPNNKHYNRYGGRGISIYKRWQDFRNFFADMGEKPKGTTLDRYPDNNGNYEPSNCRWATRKEQANNKSSNVLIVHNGERLIMKQFVRQHGLNYERFQYLYRIKRMPLPTILDTMSKEKTQNG